MKNFFVYLLKGIGIALAISLIICFFAWNWGNWRVILWGAAGVIIGWRVLIYLCGKVWVPHYSETSAGKTNQGHYATITEKIENLLVEATAIAAVAAVFWLIGRFGEWFFDKHASIFELTIANGFVLFAECVFGIVALASLFYSIRHFNRDDFKSVLPEIIKWLLIIGISIAVGIAVLYFLLPASI